MLQKIYILKNAHMRRTINYNITMMVMISDRNKKRALLLILRQSIFFSLYFFQLVPLHMSLHYWLHLKKNKKMERAMVLTASASAI